MENKAPESHLIQLFKDIFINFVYKEIHLGQVQ